LASLNAFRMIEVGVIAVVAIFANTFISPFGGSLPSVNILSVIVAYLIAEFAMDKFYR
jgi:hypothetical protein